jgi:hypothetical protein
MNILMKAPGSIDGYHFKIDIHLGKDDGLLSSTGLCFTLNRYDNPIHGLPDLNCEEASPLKGSIFPEQGGSIKGVVRNIGGDIAEE